MESSKKARMDKFMSTCSVRTNGAGIVWRGHVCAPGATAVQGIWKVEVGVLLCYVNGLALAFLKKLP